MRSLPSILHKVPGRLHPLNGITTFSLESPDPFDTVLYFAQKTFLSPFYKILIS